MPKSTILPPKKRHRRHILGGCSLWDLIRRCPMPDMGGRAAIAQMTAQNEAVKQKVDALERLMEEVRDQKQETAG